MHIWRRGNWASLQFISFPEVTQLVKWWRQDEWKEIRFQRLNLQWIWTTAPRELLLWTTSVFILSPQINYKLVYGQHCDFCAFWIFLSQHTVDKDAFLPLTGLSLNHNFFRYRATWPVQWRFTQSLLLCAAFLSFLPMNAHQLPGWLPCQPPQVRGISCPHGGSTSLSLCPSALLDFWCPQTLATTWRPFAMPGLHNAPKSTFQAHKSQRILHTEL